MNEKTPSRTSPQGGNRGCLCEDGTYSIECCDGSLQAQGVGSLVDGGIVNLTQNIIERTITSGQPSATPILDTYPNAIVGYSFRLLNSSYTGNCIRVRRSNDNAEQDIGFDGNTIDTASLLSFCGVNSGYVTTWYNQAVEGSDNANNSTAIYQPLIVLNGSLQMVNGKPSLFCGSNSVLYVGNTTTFKYLHDGTIRSSTVTVMQTASTLSGLKFLWLTGTSGGGSIQAQMYFSGTSIRQQIKNATTSINNNALTNSVSTSSDYLVWQTFDGGNPTPSEKIRMSLNDDSDIAKNNGNFTPSTADSTLRMHLFNYRFPSVGLGTNGYCQEMIFWKDDYTADKEDISNNINDYYEIY